MVRSDFWDYSVAYIVVKGIYLLNEIMMLKKEVNLENALFNNIFIDNAEDLNIVMSMNDLLKFSDNYSVTPESL